MTYLIFYRDEEFATKHDDPCLGSVECRNRTLALQYGEMLGVGIPVIAYPISGRSLGYEIENSLDLPGLSLRELV